MGSLFRTEGLVFNKSIKYSDIEVRSGENTFITGASGVGKSTLLRIFNGTVTPMGGKVFFMDKNIEEINTIELRRKAILAGQDVFLFDKNIRENFKSYFQYRELPLISEEKMQFFLELCGCEFSLDKDCTTMSGGERQRTFLSIFLALAPEVFLMDEPTSALDVDTGMLVMFNILNYCLKNNIATVTVSHNPNITDALAQSIIKIGNVENTEAGGAAIE